jgi:leucyl-tRNA synthetase
MAFHGTFTSRKQVNQLVEVQGAKLIGTKVNKGTLHSLLLRNSFLCLYHRAQASSHRYSPDDFQTLVDLRKKPKLYNIDPAWVSIDPVPVLCTPTYGNMTAPALVEALKILSQKDKVRLAEAKEITYKEGFYNGTMIVGSFLERVKAKVRESMIKQGVAFAYAEPDGLVISRSGDECVVVLVDQ